MALILFQMPKIAMHCVDEGNEIVRQRRERVPARVVSVRASVASPPSVSQVGKVWRRVLYGEKWSVIRQGRWCSPGTTEGVCTALPVIFLL